MNFGPGEWVAGLCAVGGLGAWVGGLTFRAGRHAEQASQFRKELDHLHKTQGEHSTAIAGWSHVAALLEEVRTDVKRIQLAGRPRGAGGNG